MVYGWLISFTYFQNMAIFIECTGQKIVMLHILNDLVTCRRIGGQLNIFDIFGERPFYSFEL